MWMGKRRRNKTLSFLHWQLTAKVRWSWVYHTPKWAHLTKRQSTKDGFSYSHKVQETDTWEDRLTKGVLKPSSASPKGNQFPVAIQGKTRHSHLGHHHVFLQIIRLFFKKTHILLNNLTCNYFFKTWDVKDHLQVSNHKSVAGQKRLLCGLAGLGPGRVFAITGETLG